jgi:hypothetical protein
MRHFGIIRYYLSASCETILAYAKVRLLLLTQKNLVSVNIHPSISNLTSFLQREGVS